MSNERWRKIKNLFNAASACDPTERAALLARMCNGDEELRREAERLVHAHERSGDFIESPAFQVAPEYVVAAPDALLGQHLASYRIDAVLGVGGMGVVYLACDERLGRKVGLKLLPPSLVADQSQLDRLKHEARTASALNHPNIVTIHEIGQVDGTHYIATEFIDGVTIRKRIAQGAIPPNDASEIALQIASALSVAHAAGIVHRDIKPENIMLRSDGYVKVLDFGIAKFTHPETPAAAHAMTQHGVILGTTRYMSPEQARGKEVDARTDIWSLGVVLYEMLAGNPPFDGETPTDVAAAVLLNDPQPLHHLIIPSSLQNVVERSLRKDPTERYQTADEVVSELRAIKESAGRRTPWTNRRKLSAVAVAVVLITAALVVFEFVRPKVALVSRNKLTRTANVAAPPVISEKSIAVLPFVNMSSDQDNAYLVDGLTEEILTRLAQIKALKVPGRTSSFVFKNQNRDLREIGAALGVAHVLEGSVRKSEDRLRITAQLLRTADGYHLWSQTYDRKIDDIFAIQEEIARAIARALFLQLKLGSEEKLDRPTQDMAAYGDYLEARGLITQRNADNLRRATTLLEAAVQRDPGFAKAWAALAQARAFGFYYLVVPIKQSLEGAENAARKALTIDDSLGAAHSVLADVLRDRYDWLAAEAEYRRALELSAGEAETHNQYAQMLLRVGHLDAGLEHASRACELDPLAWVPPSIAALIHLARGDLGQSRVWLDRSEKAFGKIDGFAIRYELMNALSARDRDLARRALAMAHFSTAIELSSPADKKLIEAMDQALASTGNGPEPTPNLRRALTDAQSLGELHVGSEVALVAAFVNQPKVALDALWYDMRPGAGVDVAWIWSTPALRSLRHEPRFRELLKAMKLPEYWRVSGWPEFCRPTDVNDFDCFVP